MSKDILGGDVETQFIYRPDTTGFDTAINAVRADQEAICGYPLMLKKQRSTEMIDADGRYIEVFVTFMPYPPKAEGHEPPVQETPPAVEPTYEHKPIPPSAIPPGTIV